MLSAISSGKLNPRNKFRNETENLGPLGSLSELVNNTVNIFKKHLYSSSSETSSLWFWDTPLPFVMAAIHDCEKLFKHDPNTIKLLRLLLKFESKYLPSLASLRKWKESQSMLFNGTEFYHDIKNFHYQNDVSMSESIDSFYFLHSLELLASNFSSEVTTERRNAIIRSVDEYFDHFATAYSFTDVNCLDIHHAGAATERLEVAQIFNLICNKYLKLPKTYCCA